MEALQRIDLHQVSEAAAGNYTNLPLNLVNDHVIRISVMTEPFYWYFLTVCEPFVNQWVEFVFCNIFREARRIN